MDRQIWTHNGASQENQDICTVNTRVDLTEEGLGVCDRPVSVLNIRSLLVFLFSQNFGVHISEKALHQFWSHATEHFEWGPAHPGRGTHVPLGLYGDSARYTNSAGYAEKLLCITLSLPLYSPKSVRSSRYLIFSIRESLMVDFATTIWPIYSYIMQELNQLFHSGIPGPQGSVRFAVCEFRGDWAFHADSMALSRRWNSHSMCFKCPATSIPGPYQYTNFGELHDFSNVGFFNNCLKPGRLCNWYFI